MGDAEDQATLASPLDPFAEGPKIQSINITEKHYKGHVLPGEIWRTLGKHIPGNEFAHCELGEPGVEPTSFWMVEFQPRARKRCNPVT